MDPFQSFSGQFNPQIYESSNVPPSTDRLFSFSGFQAGLMASPNVSNTVNQPQFLQQPYMHQQQQQQHLPTIPTQATIVSGPPPPPPPNGTQSDQGRYSGMYANTGFDMLTLLSRVVNR
jgi:hypothetical protein